MAEEFYAAAQAGDGAKACELVVSDYKKVLADLNRSVGHGEPDCAKGFKYGVRVLAVPKDAKATDESVDGDSATVTLEGSDRTIKVLLRKEAGEWKFVGAQPA